jgi:Zn ribbon nucleic-acid-binding protein
MAGACSRHKFIDANCEQCHSDLNAKELREKNTPKIKCIRCFYTFYIVDKTASCPFCGTEH